MASSKQVHAPRTQLVTAAGAKHHPGEVWKTTEGMWRSMNRGGVTKSFDDKDQAQTHARGGGKSTKAPGTHGKAPHGKPEHGEDHDEHDDHGDPGLKETVLKFLDKLKDAPAATVDFIKKSPENVKKFITDKDHRKEVMSSVATSMKDGAKKVPKLIKDATKAELEEIKSGVVAVKKLFKRPPEKLSKHDKKALYAVGAYVAGAAVGAVSGGAAMAAGSFGKAFLKHIATKAISGLLDAGFTHFEVGESAVHGLHHIMEHVASPTNRADSLAYLRLAAEGGDEGAGNEALVAYIHAAVQETMGKGLSDNDMAEIVKSMGQGEEKEPEAQTEKKASSLRSSLIRLAHEVPGLRPHLLPLLDTKTDK